MILTAVTLSSKEHKHGFDSHPCPQFKGNDMKKGFTAVEVLIVIAIISLIIGMFIQPYFEMRTFNKFSKEKATYMDALCSELRIEANRANGTSTE